MVIFKGAKTNKEQVQIEQVEGIYIIYNTLGYRSLLWKVCGAVFIVGKELLLLKVSTICYNMDSGGTQHSLRTWLAPMEDLKSKNATK